MFEYFKQSGLLRSFTIHPEEGMKWAVLQKKDIPLGNPPLHAAVEGGDRAQVEVCLDRGDDINESDGRGSTPLHVAIRKGDYALYTYLLSLGARIDLTNGEGKSPLHLASCYDKEGCFVQDLLDRGSNINKDEHCCRSPLEFALIHKNKKAEELLIAAGAKISKRDLQKLKELGISFDESIVLATSDTVKNK